MITSHDYLIVSCDYHMINFRFPDADMGRLTLGDIQVLRWTLDIDGHWTLMITITLIPVIVGGQQELDSVDWW